MVLRARTLLALCLPVSALACLERIELDGARLGPDGAPSDPGEPAAPDEPGGGVAPADSAAGAVGSPISESRDVANTRLTVPLAPDGSVGCSKIDFLFVIDNSLSMALAQDSLKANFPSLLGELETTLNATDFHIMVVDTDGRDADDAGDGASTEQACDVLGAGRRTNGQSGGDCGLPEAQRFAAPSPEVESVFACTATVGTRGEPREQQAGALLAAVSSEQNGAGGCNTGFARPDALLVVTLVTNTDDDASADDPQAWYEAIVRAKAGNEAAVVMLGFLPGEPVVESSSGLLCDVVSGFNPAPRLEDLVTRFSRHQIASVCEADYGPLFASAVEDIARACDAFVSPATR